MRGLLSILCAVVLATGAAACGEKDESAATAPSASGSTSASGGGGSGGGSVQTQGDDPESQINNAVINVIGGNDPKQVCEEFATAVYVKHAYGDVSGCRAAVAKRAKVEVDVTIDNVGGRTATATAKPKGGPNGGETLKVDLVRQGEVWKVDLVRSNAPVGP